MNEEHRDRLRFLGVAVQEKHNLRDRNEYIRHLYQNALASADEIADELDMHVTVIYKIIRGQSAT